jgi:16S rRNA G527 N7-methylase RsmG
VKQKEIKDCYISELKAWNRVHRITGSNDIDLLYSESIEGLKTLPKEVRGLVDVGAGSGILGFPAIIDSGLSRVLFVEPDIKKASFLIHMKTKIRSIDSSMADSMVVLAKDIQSVSRETIDQFFVGCPYVLAARAFSGSCSLKDAVAKSPMQNIDVFFFHSTHNGKFVLEKL